MLVTFPSQVSTLTVSSTFTRIPRRGELWHKPHICTCQCVDKSSLPSPRSPHSIPHKATALAYWPIVAQTRSPATHDRHCLPILPPAAFGCPAPRLPPRYRSCVSAPCGSPCRHRLACSPPRIPFHTLPLLATPSPSSTKTATVEPAGRMLGLTGFYLPHETSPDR